MHVAEGCPDRKSHGMHVVFMAECLPGQSAPRRVPKEGSEPGSTSPSLCAPRLGRGGAWHLPSALCVARAPTGWGVTFTGTRKMGVTIRIYLYQAACLENILPSSSLGAL